MGWNTSALLVHDRPAEQAMALLVDEDRFRATGEWVTADRASSHRLGADRLAVADDGPWCWIWDPHQRFVPDTWELRTGTGRALQALAGTRAMAALFSSVSTIYGFWLYDDAELVRRAVFQDGSPVDEVGAPLPFEADLQAEDWFSEAALWSAVGVVTGLSFRPEQRFQVYAER